MATTKTNSATTVPSAAALDLLKNLNHIQGNILSGFNKDYQTFLFLTFTDQNKARRWVGDISSEVASADEVQDFHEVFKKTTSRRGGELGILKATWMNVAFSFSGLEMLGAAAADLALFPPEFKEGMANRGKVLGDVGNSDPKNWVLPLGTKSIHALMIVASDDQNDLGQHVLRYVHNMGVNGGVQVAFVQEGAVRQDDPGHEHFGFRDGVSQPAIRKLDAHTPGMVAPAEPINADPGQDRLHAGEFVIGYPTQIPIPKKCPKGVLNPNPDEGPISPKHLSPNLTGPEPATVSDDETAPDWAVNGSFLVFRRLAQDVKGFQDMVVKKAAEAGLTEEQFGAKLVGRYKSGAPLELTKDEEELIKQKKLPATFDPTTTDPSESVANALNLPADFKKNDGNLAEDNRLNNHFEYGDDVSGAIVPRAAHIRKVYPRDENTPGGGESDTQTHRIMRRGIPFGTSFRPGLGAVGHAGKPGVEEPKDRGLLFLCYQSSIRRQFEFIQRNWVHNADFPQPKDGEDPIIAQTPEGKITLITGTDGTAQQSHLLLLKHFVTMTGGEYFFQPSIDILTTKLGDLRPSAQVTLPTATDAGDDDDPKFDPCSTAEPEVAGA